jgi:hypothetical protein
MLGSSTGHQPPDWNSAQIEEAIRLSLSGLPRHDAPLGRNSAAGLSGLASTYVGPSNANMEDTPWREDEEPEMQLAMERSLERLVAQASRQVDEEGIEIPGS